MNNIWSQWRQLVQESRNQWSENARLRYGIVAILLIFILWLNLLLNDLVTELQSSEQDAFNVLIEQEQDNQSDDWVARLEKVKAAIDSMSPRFGRAQNGALARAELQSKIATLINKNGLGTANIEVSSAPEIDKSTALLPLQLRVSGLAQGDKLLALLLALETSTPVIKLEHLVVSNQVGEQLVYTFIATVWYHPFGAQQ
jgi:Tfp pilus assembly protein PilO